MITVIVVVACLAYILIAAFAFNWEGKEELNYNVLLVLFILICSLQFTALLRSNSASDYFLILSILIENIIFCWFLGRVCRFNIFVLRSLNLVAEFSHKLYIRLKRDQQEEQAGEDSL